MADAAADAEFQEDEAEIEPAAGPVLRADGGYRMLIKEEAFQTDYLTIPGYWIVRCRGFWDSKHSGIALTVVPWPRHEPPDGGWGSS